MPGNGVGDGLLMNVSKERRCLSVRHGRTNDIVFREVKLSESILVGVKGLPGRIFTLVDNECKLFPVIPVHERAGKGGSVEMVLVECRRS